MDATYANPLFNEEDMDDPAVSLLDDNFDWQQSGVDNTAVRRPIPMHDMRADAPHQNETTSAWRWIQRLYDRQTPAQECNVGHLCVIYIIIIIAVAFLVILIYEYGTGTLSFR